MENQLVKTPGEVIIQLILVSAFHISQKQCSPSSLPLLQFIN